MATIEKRTRSGQTTWRVRYRDPGADNPRSLTCPDQKTSKVLAGEIERWFILHPGLDYPRDGAPQPTLLADLCVDFLQLEIARKCAPSTLENYSGILDRFLAFVRDEHATVDLLSADLLSRWDLDIAERGAGRATRDRNTRLVHCAWRFGVGRPRTYHGVPPLENWTLTRAPRPRTIAPTWAEVDACVRELRLAVGRRHTGARQAAVIGAFRAGIVCRYTGLRIKQVQSLRWTDLDEALGILVVREGKTAAETAMRREIPVSKHLLAEVAGWTRDGEQIVPAVTTDTLRERMRAAWITATLNGEARADVWKMTEKNGRRNEAVTHCMRKALVSGLKLAGADDEAVEYLIGHASGLRGHYVDPAALPLKETVALIPAICPPKEMPHVSRTERSGAS